MRVFFDALGCPKALVDSERLTWHLLQAGHEFVGEPESADLIIVNTCGFITPAKQESIDAILSYGALKEQNPNLRLVVSGCLTERYREEILREIPEIDAILGVRDPSAITQALHSSGPTILDDGPYQEQKNPEERSLLFSGLYYSYLKIAEGCDRRCAFCAIPLIRGPYRSRSRKAILESAGFLQRNGVAELILIAEDTSIYGADLKPRGRLDALLDSLLAETDFPWIRLMYLFPSDDLIEIAERLSRETRLCNYMDLPLQHASKPLLRAMNRPGDAESYLRLIQTIRERNPEIAIRSAFIVGFPGETDEDFQRLKDFLRKAEFDRAGFFLYSDEESTTAFDLPDKVPEFVARERLQELASIQREVSRELLRRRIGQEILCINDGITGEWEGRAVLYLRTEWDAPEIDGRVLADLPRDDNWIEKPFFKLRIMDRIGEHDLWGRIL